MFWRKLFADSYLNLTIVGNIIHWAKSDIMQLRRYTSIPLYYSLIHSKFPGALDKPGLLGVCTGYVAGLEPTPGVVIVAGWSASQCSDTLPCWASVQSRWSPERRSHCLEKGHYHCLEQKISLLIICSTFPVFTGIYIFSALWVSFITRHLTESQLAHNENS